MPSSVKNLENSASPVDLRLPLQGIIFDMDGVLVDSEPRHEQAFLEVFTELGYAESHGIDFDRYLGMTDRAVVEDFVEHNEISDSVKTLIDRKQARLIKLLEADQPLFEPIPHLLKDLSTRYALSLASGSPHRVIDTVLALQDIGAYLPVTVSSEDVLRGKPAPDIFLETADRMGLEPQQLCVVEDSVAGVSAARAAGMQVIAITNSFPAERLVEADRIVANYGEIRRLLLG
ncbi:MAG: hypothetical protein CBC48_03565 [bacterium TMED88]|nr:hypothetical protein [Deltaproteobacteria bacterium]OUV35654.1 MAG: hypothetical protein CBC48_03565 [bacterium TMED88]